MKTVIGAGKISRISIAQIQGHGFDAGFPAKKTLSSLMYA